MKGREKQGVVMKVWTRDKKELSDQVEACVHENNLMWNGERK